MPDSSRLVAIQYLRGFAALAVVFAHSLQHILDMRGFDVLKTGRFGVVLFFAISGFIMVHISGRECFSPITFMRRRLLRVAPLYWLATSIVAIVLIVAPGVFRNSVFTVEHYVLSLLFVPHVDQFGDKSPMLSLGWTLNYEIFFYALFAVLGLVPGKVRVRLLTAIFAMLMACGLAFAPQSRALFTYTGFFLLPFIAGAWIGWFALEGRVLPVGPASLWITVSLLIALAPLAWVVEAGERGGPLTIAAMTLWSSVAIWLGYAARAVVPVCRFPRLVGDASYSIYLVHMFAIGAVAVLVGHLGIAGFIAVALAFAGGTAGGLITYRFVERPLLHMARTTGGRSPERAALARG